MKARLADPEGYAQWHAKLYTPATRAKMAESARRQMLGTRRRPLSTKAKETMQFLGFRSAKTHLKELPTYKIKERNRAAFQEAIDHLKATVYCVLCIDDP